MSNNHHRDLIRLLSGLRETLDTLFVTCGQISAEAAELLLQRLLLGLELLWKLEEQVLMPALQRAAPEWAPDVAAGAQEIEVMRDLSLRLQDRRLPDPGIGLGALEGVVRLHWLRSDELLARAAQRELDWRALHDEVQGLLARWGEEIRAHGEIEDEERDPVGLPPR